MNTTETNRQIAIDFYRRYDAGNIDGALALMADDATFWIAGQPGSTASAGLQTKAQIADIFRRMDGALTGPLRMTVKHTVAEGDHVAVEAESRGELKNGRIYSQQYHALFTLRGGQIAAVREYMDTRHVQEVWYSR
ncbi:MAG: nuclear transport factor 2 family protein [Ramlibacter sp.]|nr:nuclear transport factor 2 family protein [Ramlibacter sp.]